MIPGYCTFLLFTQSKKSMLESIFVLTNWKCVIWVHQDFKVTKNSPSSERGALQ